MSKNERQVDGEKLYKINTQKQNRENTQENRLLKDRFFEALAKSELGTVENSGTVVTLKEFKAYFSDIKTD